MAPPKVFHNLFYMFNTIIYDKGLLRGRFRYDLRYKITDGVDFAPRLLVGKANNDCGGRSLFVRRVDEALVAREKYQRG